MTRRERLDLWREYELSNNWLGDVARKVLPDLEAEYAVWLALQLSDVRDLPDDQIDTSDIPEVTDWSCARRGMIAAQRIEARSDETLQAAQPEGREPGPKDAPDLNRSSKG